MVTWQRQAVCPLTSPDKDDGRVESATHVTRLQIPRRSPHGRGRRVNDRCHEQRRSARGAGVVAGYCRSYATSWEPVPPRPESDRAKPSRAGMGGGTSRVSAVTLQRCSTGRGSGSAVSSMGKQRVLLSRGNGGGEAILQRACSTNGEASAKPLDPLRRRPDMRRGSTFPRASSETTRACSGEAAWASVSEVSQAPCRNRKGGEFTTYG